MDIQNESGEIVTPQTNNESVAEVQVEPKADTPEEVKEEKPKRSPEEELKYYEGRAKRLRKELGIKEEEAPKKITKKPSDELDYGQKAYLKASGIDNQDFEFFQQTMQDTGKDLDTLLESKWFKEELKERKDQREVSRATPSPSRLPGESAKSKVEYYLNRGEMPADTPENRKLRQEIVEARYQRARNAR
jgi:hypothetical protein